MAGIWDRVKFDAENRMGGHAFDTIYTLYSQNKVTRQQIVDRLNSIMDTPLSNGELVDLGKIADEMDTFPDVPTKSDYADLVRASVAGAEQNIIQSESEFFTILGIS